MEGQVIWITGLSGSGKTTVSNVLLKRLKKRHYHPILLDGDNLRNLITNVSDVNETYTREARITLSKRYSQLCKLLSSQGFTVIIATVSMFAEIYKWNRSNLPNYFEVYLDVPLKELRRRDPKNLYEKFYSGAIKNVAGLDLKIDKPDEPNLIINFTPGQNPDEIVNIIIRKLELDKVV